MRNQIGGVRTSPSPQTRNRKTASPLHWTDHAKNRKQRDVDTSSGSETDPTAQNSTDRTATNQNSARKPTESWPTPAKRPNPYCYTPSRPAETRCTRPATHPQQGVQPEQPPARSSLLAQAELTNSPPPQGGLLPVQNPPTPTSTRTDGNRCMCAGWHPPLPPRGRASGGRACGRRAARLPPLRLPSGPVGNRRFIPTVRMRAVAQSAPDRARIETGRPCSASASGQCET